LENVNVRFFTQDFGELSQTVLIKNEGWCIGATSFLSLVNAHISVISVTREQTLFILNGLATMLGGGRHPEGMKQPKPS